MYFVTAAFIIVATNILAGYLISKYYNEFYFYSEEQAEYDRKHYRTFRNLKVGDFNDYNTPGIFWTHVAITVAALFWRITIPTILFLAILLVLGFGLYQATKWAVLKGRPNVDQSN